MKIALFPTAAPMKSARTVAAENINVNPVILQNMPVLTSITAYPIPIRAKIIPLIKNIATVTAKPAAPSARTAVLQTTESLNVTWAHVKHRAYVLLTAQLNINRSAIHGVAL